VADPRQDAPSSAHAMVLHMGAKSMAVFLMLGLHKFVMGCNFSSSLVALLIFVTLKNYSHVSSCTAACEL
jgi:hypothetical protein